MPAYTKLKSNEIFEIMLAISQNSTTVDGFLVYNEGWSDKRVQEHLVTKGLRQVPLGSVLKLRQENYGNLRPARPPKPKSSIEARLDAIETWLRLHLNYTPDGK